MMFGNACFASAMMFDIRQCVIAAGLGMMLSHPSCQIRALNLNSTHITSHAWAFLTEGLRIHKTIAHLDLSWTSGD